jgi:hypothetical protein
MAFLASGGPGIRLAPETSYVVRALLSLRVLRKVVLDPGLVFAGAGSHPIGQHGGSYTSRVLSASLTACLDLHRGGSVVLSWCLGGWAGRMSLRGAAFSAGAREVSLRALSVTTGPRIAWSLSERSSLFAGPELVVGAQPMQVVVLDGSAETRVSENIPRAGVALTFGLSYALLSPASEAQPVKTPAPTQGFPSRAHE